MIYFEKKPHQNNIKLMKLFNSKTSKSRLLNAKKIIQTSAFEVLTCFKKKQITAVVVIICYMLNIKFVYR